MMDYESWFLNSFKTNIKKKMKKLNITIEQLINYFFIKYYKIKDNEITIYFANGKITVPYNRNLEERILEKMKLQIEEWNEKKANINKGYPIGALFYILHGSRRIIENYNPENIIECLPYTSWLLVALLWLTPLPCSLIKKQDIKKHILFLENEEKLNEMIKKQMINLGIIDEYALNIAPLFESYITINDVHFLNKRELEKLINGNITKEAIYKLKKD